MGKTIIRAVVIYHINGFQQKPMEFKTFELPSANDIVMPFLQSYKYRVLYTTENFNVINVHLETFCDSAKNVYKDQIKSLRLHSINIHIKTQKIYTFPDRKFYGEYCLLSLLELRIKIVAGEIKEKLCYIDSNGRAYVYDELGIPEGYSEDCMETIHTDLLHKLLNEQLNIRTSKRNK